MKWAYGVTTCEKRLETLLPKTLLSLRKGGFGDPRLFVDGCDNPKEVQHRLWKHDQELLELKVTCRPEPIKTYGNWVLGMWELFLREPDADAYAMFQDDLLMCRNVRWYLEALGDSGKMNCGGGYFNLFTWGPIEAVIRYAAPGFLEGIELANEEGTTPKYHGRVQQKAAGAVALVFSHLAVATLLTSPHIAQHACEALNGWRNLDGSVGTAMNKAGFREYVHAPSLVQHTGLETSLDEGPNGAGKLTDEHKGSRKRWIARSFPGEDFDAMEFLK